MAIRHDFCHDSAKSMQASLALAAPKVPWFPRFSEFFRYKKNLLSTCG